MGGKAFRVDLYSSLDMVEARLLEISPLIVPWTLLSIFTPGRKFFGVNSGIPPKSFESGS